MSEDQAPYAPSTDRTPPDLFEAVMARYCAESDPRLLELLDNARRAFDELAHVFTPDHLRITIDSCAKLILCLRG